MRLKPHQQEKFQRRRRLLAHERRMRAVEHARHYAETVKRLLVEGQGAGLRELGRRLETAGVQPVSVWTPRPGPGRPPKASWSTSQVRALLRQVEALTAPPPRSIKWRLGRAASLHARAATLPEGPRRAQVERLAECFRLTGEGKLRPVRSRWRG
jgi:hypothetical protein